MTFEKVHALHLKELEKESLALPIDLNYVFSWASYSLYGLRRPSTGCVYVLEPFSSQPSWETVSTTSPLLPWFPQVCSVHSNYSNSNPPAPA